MANETPMDNKELPVIKHLKDIKAEQQRTGDLVKNESTANSIIASALPEVLNDTRLYYNREALDHKEGVFKVDDYLRALIIQNARFNLDEILIKDHLEDLVKATRKDAEIFTLVAKDFTDGVKDMTDAVTDKKKKDLTPAQRKEEKKEEYMRETAGEKKTASFFKGLGDKFTGFRKSFLGKAIFYDLILVAILTAISFFRPLAETIERFFRTTGQLFRGEISFFQYIGENFILMGGIALVLFRKTLGRLLARVLLGGVGGIGFFAQLGKVIMTIIKSIFSPFQFLLKNSALLGGQTKMKIFTRSLKFLFLGLGKLAGLIIAIPMAIFGFLRGFITGFNREFQRGEKGVLGFVGALLSAIAQGLYNALFLVLDFFTFGLFSKITGAVEDFDIGQWVSDIFAAIVSGVVNAVAAVGDSLLSLFSSKPVGVTGSVNPLTVKENDKRFAAMSGSNINNRTSINNFTTVNANNNSSRSDTTVSNRSVDNTGYGSQNAGLT